MMPRNLPSFRQSGVSLIEVLVVFFVLGIGLLGLAALQLKSVQYNQAAYYRSQANVAAYDILDRMRLNKSVATASGYDTDYTTAAPTGSTMVATDLQDWKTFLSNSLPGGQGKIACSSTSCTVYVQWVDALTAGGTTTQTLTVVSQL